MLEQRSALAAVYEPGRIGARERPASVAVFEQVGRTLVQVSGWPGAFDPVCRKLETLLNCRMPDFRPEGGLRGSAIDLSRRPGTAVAGGTLG